MKQVNSILISGIILLVGVIFFFVKVYVSYSEGIPNYHRGQPMTNVQGFLASAVGIILVLYVFYIYFKNGKP